ncbi:hypothetical protein SteCoe_2983 [Stentor coeruleus]|uniref:EGF-like domain-containing protein n=1 Tax=Stentor coeruleus TaxID=5963 RepID=A0A1R2CY77_9CILI|nr:hypothetical protein SteCoe_2983 [Stentor coeruleus]
MYLIVLSISLLFIVSGQESIKISSQYISGNCMKMLSIFEKIYLPEIPLIYLKLSIRLDDLDPELSEYPTPKPKTFIRYDAVPNENFYSYKVSLKKSKTILAISEAYPRYSKFLVIRIDGGLLDSLHIMNAYTVKGWDYYITLNAYYCPSGLYTILPIFNTEFYDSNICNSKIFTSSELSQGSNPLMIFTPPTTELMEIHTNTNFTISPNNFCNNLTSGNQSILNPISGWWFLIVNYDNNSFFSLSFQPCNINISTTCNNQPLQHIDFIPIFNKIPSSSTFKKTISSQIIQISLEILESQIKYRYGIEIYSKENEIDKIFYGPRGVSTQRKLCNNHDQYCKNKGNSFMGELEYLEYGIQYITIYMKNSSSYQFGLFKTKSGDNMCHDNPTWDYDDIAYYCFCLQNKAGFYCQKDAISNSIYMLSVMMLTISNLAMIPAVVYGIKTHAYVEATSYAGNMIASYIYHFCDEQYYCFNFPYQTLISIDFILSYYSICISIVFLSKISQPKIKYSLNLLILIILMYIGLGTNFDSTIIVAIVLTLVSMVPLSRYFYFIYVISKRDYNKRFSCLAFKMFFYTYENFRLRWLVYSIICLISAIINRALENNTNYYITHSFWHLSIMFCALCVLRGVNMKNIGFYIEDKDEDKESRVQLAETSLLSVNN